MSIMSISKLPPGFFFITRTLVYKIGLTVLKKKCREFGIPRWPHRKIKSLDRLIHELQDIGQQQKDDEVAVAVLTKRQEKLKEERESIERKPFMEIQTDTKKFR
ncbi:hypothetical protein LWI28_015115 [Acer negundo]|uniref:RWP-RK domain-containing protein n=1 Tax=Acer negundo TaxID=4023 RepID=A0AAD5IJG7_ACENE|nr:hypothetical protein LWI28_015115 [Acer negundo]